MSLCLAAGMLTAVLNIDSFTLAWTHSIEKIRWEEDWQIENGRLVIVEARVRGTGAGMEPPLGAKLVDGVWHYRPALAPLESVALAHSPYAKPYELCLAGLCRPLTVVFPGIGANARIVLEPCTGRSGDVGSTADPAD